MARLISRKHTLMTAIIMLLATVFLSTTPAFGQATSTGTVVGTITDPTGAVIAGATVTLTQAATSTVRTTTTTATGQYILVNVPTGDYTIRVTKAGFSISEIQHQTVSVGTQTTADLELTVGGTQTVVEVSSQSSKADLQTMNAAIGDTVNPLEITSLPSVARDVSTFATLQPGVTPGGSVAGTVSDQAVFQLDGGNNSSDMDGSMQSYTGAFGGNTSGVSSIGNGSSGVMPMPQDSIEEFKVATVGQTADFNNSSGMQAQVVTKRGTNTWHGTVYEYYLDSNIGANSWQNNFPTNKALGTTYLAKPSNHYNRFGAAAGGPVLPSFLGGKTYLFANYEGFRFPNSATYERSVPSPSLLAGTVNFSGSTSGTYYNLQAVDPRGIGLNPTVAKMWSTQLPAGNDTGCGAISGARCDGINTIGYKANISIPQKSDFGVARLDHDFGSKWHFMTSYRYFKLTKAVTNQVDIGGVLGGKLGTPTSIANRPQDPWYYVAGLTTNINSTWTNDFHYSYLRNVWSWNDANAPAQLAGLGGALEPFGEYSTTTLSPYNVDTQDIRTRFWDGHDHFLRDDVTKLKGNHLFQFGGQYQHNYNFHQRTDNGGGINFTTTYQLGDSSGGGLVTLPGLAAAGVPTSTTTNARILDAALGIVTDSQVAYTRSGNNLSLNAPLTPAQDKATIPYYNLYLSDTWHIKPTLTINYGLGWALEMPPVEKTGKQVVLVDSADEPIKAADYLTARKTAALQGQVYNPQVGFALVGAVGSGLKYPYNPYYGSFSPRISAAWNPHFTSDTFLGHVFGTDSTVLRGGYGRVYGRLNGVGLVLTPLLGPGLIQAVQCRTAAKDGTCSSSNPTDSTAFRIGVDGNMAPLTAATQTLPQPLYPGYNGAATASSDTLDPNFRPNVADTFNLTVQRQLTRKMLIEVGYIGRIIHNEFQPINLNTVPYMMSQGGQSFASAYAAVETAWGCATSAGLCSNTTTAATSGIGTPKMKVYPTVSPQAFFETALANTGYCTGYTNCTTAVVHKEASNLGNQQVFNLWSDLDNGGFNFARSMQGTPIPGQAQGANGQLGSGAGLSASTGYGNYNAGFVSFKTTDFYGLTLQENFTYSKALGTGAEAQATSEYTPNDAFDLGKSYGVQQYNQKFIFNTFLVYQTPWYKNQSGLLGRAAGGWTFSPILTAGTGQPLNCETFSGAQAFGGADDLNYGTTEQCIFTSAYTGGYHTHRGISGSPDPNGVQVGTAVAVKGSSSGSVNMFSNPGAVYGQVRPAILGIDNRDSGNGPISGLPYWNIDMGIHKNVKIWESTSLQFSGVITNIFNHNVFSNPGFSLATPASFGVVTTQGSAPRSIEMGVRANF
ncbi:MAG: carboxypeptidase-like regulatory domain-containing protein [Edaphobacter sp.]